MFARRLTNRSAASVLLLWLALLPCLAHAQEPPQPPTNPQLRIETGRHTASIKQIGMDVAQKFLVTASDDKTVRVWDRATGTLLRTLRPPIGTGNEGKLYAVAISPDGQTVVCAGSTGDMWDNSVCIYCFDRASGQITHRITGLPDVILRLAFSPDSKYFAVTLGGKKGLRVYRANNYEQVAEDKDYGDGVYDLDWDNTGRIVTTCLDGSIRLYSADFTLAKKREAPGGKQPFGVRFSPDGNRIAVGFWDTPRVSVLSAEDLTLQFSPDVTGVDHSNLLSVCWSIDGSRLFAAGKYSKGSNSQIRCWEDAGKGRATDWSGAQNTIFDLLPLRDGGIAFTSAEPTLGLLDNNGKLLWRNVALTADYRDNLEGFLLSGDGTTVQFGFEEFGKSPARFNVAAHRLESSPPDDAALGSLHPPRITAPDLTITDWQNNNAPKRNSEPLTLKQYEFSHSLAITPDTERFLLGTGYYLRCYNRDGKPLWQAIAPGIVWSVNISGNGKLGVAAFADGTIRWFRMSDGVELLALFPHGDKKRWVAWTPLGFYDCSVGGEDLLGWHLNNGKATAADFYPGSRFHDALYRPDIIQRVLITLDEAKAVQLANEAANRKPQTVDIAKELPPVIQVVAPDGGLSTKETKVTIYYSLRAPSGEPVTGLRVYIDGRPAESTPRALSRVPKTASESVEGETVVTIPPHNCEISLIAENRFARSVKSVVLVSWKDVPAEDPLKPTLYILAAGVSAYNEAGMTLHYPAKDAKDFVDAMQAQKGLLYKDVVVRLLRDSEVTRDSVVEGLDWIQRQTQQRDVAMVFLSGHGGNDRTGNFYYAPYNCAFDTLKTRGVAYSEFSSTFKAIAGKALLFLDTCYAGNVVGGLKTKGEATDTTAIVNELSRAENGTIVFASSTRNESSLENDEWNNGAFTKALVEGLNGKADVRGTHRVTVTMLCAYVADRVKELTKGSQHPVNSPIEAQSSTSDFPLAIVK